MSDVLKHLKAGEIGALVNALLTSVGVAPSPPRSEALPAVGESPIVSGARQPDSPTVKTRARKGRFLSAQFDTVAGGRPYHLYVPGAYTDQPLPLLVMLHGCFQNPVDFAKGTRMNELAEAAGWFVLYPAQDTSANVQRCWNWFQANDQRRGAGEPSILAAMTQQVSEKYGIDRRRIYVAGLSAGGAMAVILGRVYPDIYAAIGVHSGLPYAVADDVPTALAAMRSGSPERAFAASAASHIPTIVFHGDKDNMVHPDNARHVIEQSLGVEVAAKVRPEDIHQERVPGGHTYTRTIHRDESGREVSEHWLVAGGGHAWFGGEGKHTDPEAPDAAGEMMRFFGQHVLAEKQ